MVRTEDSQSSDIGFNSHIRHCGCRTMASTSDCGSDDASSVSVSLRSAQSMSPSDSLRPLISAAFKDCDSRRLEPNRRCSASRVPARAWGSAIPNKLPVKQNPISGFGLTWRNLLWMNCGSYYDYGDRFVYNGVIDKKYFSKPNTRKFIVDRINIQCYTLFKIERSSA